MITNDGKEIISKFLLGQVPAYGTYLSIGCGATPLDLNDLLSNDLYAKQRMDFEMTRIPISSKGFVDNSQTYLITYKQVVSSIATLTTSVNHDIVPGETVVVSSVDNLLNGQFRVLSVTDNTFDYSIITPDIDPAVAVSPSGSVIVSRTKVSLTAELPADNRYEITEIGLWSSASNSLTSQYDSRMIFNFTQSWQKHAPIVGGGSTTETPQLNPNLGYNQDTNSTTPNIYDESVNPTVFFANTNDPLFQVNTRKARKEGPRYLNTTLMVRGDSATITTPDGLDGDWVADAEESTHIQLDNINFDISGNNTSDLLKLAFSLVDKTAVDVAQTKDVKIMMEFYKTRVNTTSGFAKAQIYIPGSYFSSNRYHVSSWEISQDVDHSNESADDSLPYTRFYTSADFSASEIRLCRIFVAVTKEDDSPSSDHYIAFDGFRIDNTTENPIYKMSGYSVIKFDGNPIIKSANTNNYVDFRFSLGVS